jgi:hypothetical protein
MARLSLNPVIYRRSQGLVRWRRNGTGTIPPQEVVRRAATCYPRLSLSNAVEAVLLDLLLEDAVKRTMDATPDEAMNRFRRLSLREKIRLTQKRNRFAGYLRGLPWQPKR